MAAVRKTIEVDLSGRKQSSSHARAFSGPDSVYEALYELASSPVHDIAARTLQSMVKQAMDYFHENRDPNVVFEDFDVEKLANLFVWERKAAAEALATFRESPGEEKLSACMFVSTAVIGINGTDPHLARLILAEIIRKGKKDAEFMPLAKITLLSISEVVFSMAENEKVDDSLMKLAESCMKRLSSGRYD